MYTDPKRLRPAGNSAQQRASDATAMDGPTIDVRPNYDELMQTAPAPFRGSLERARDQKALAHLGGKAGKEGKKHGHVREVPVVLHFNPDQPGETPLVTNSMAFGTPSLVEKGKMVPRDLSKAVVYEIRVHGVNNSPDMAGISFNHLPGTISHPTDENHSGWRATWLPGETRDVVVHKAKRADDPRGLARRMLAGVKNQINVDEDIRARDYDNCTMYVVGKDTPTAKKIEGWQYHPKNSPKGDFLISNKADPDKYPEKHIVRLDPVNQDLVLDATALQHVCAKLGSHEPTAEERVHDAEVGYMNLKTLAMKVEHVPASGQSTNAGTGFDNHMPEDDDKFSARVTIRYVPQEDAVERANEAIANNVHAKFGGASSSNGKRSSKTSSRRR